MVLTIVLLVTPVAGAASYRLPPRGHSQWYWELDPATAGLTGLPPTNASYPSPGSADIWDTDLFEDASHVRAGIPTGPSAVVSALHASGKYSICYVEAGAYQTGFPDDRDFAPADYGDGARRYAMPGWPGEWWLNITGFSDYEPGRSSTLTGAAVNIAAGLARRIRWCAAEGHDALEPDDSDSYANRGLTGVRGGGWHLTRADGAGFERWLAHQAHADGLAIFQKNDAGDAATNASVYDGMIVEQCNQYRDPCAGPHGDATPYLRLGKPVLNAEYTGDGESRSSFCPSDLREGITGALFNVGLNGAVYRPCAPAAKRLVRPVALGLPERGDRLQPTSGSSNGLARYRALAVKRSDAGALRRPRTCARDAPHALCARRTALASLWELPRNSEPRSR